MSDTYINPTGVAIIRNWANGKFALDSDLDALATTVQGIVAEGGEPNTIESVTVNGTSVTPDANKNIALTVPTATSDLTNDGDGTSNYATEAYVTTNGGKIDHITVNGTEQTITNKTVALTMPTKVSDLQNDGDGTSGSAFATESYVNTNGGKIDVIKVNGTSQTITNKEVNLTVPTAVSDLTNDSGFQTASDVSTAISTAVASVYKPKGSIAFANLPTLTAANKGNVYNITDAFVTTSDFVEGAGKSYPAGTNVAIVDAGTEQNPSYKYDVLAGFIDTSALWAKTELVAMTTQEIEAILNPSS